MRAHLVLVTVAAVVLGACSVMIGDEVSCSTDADCTGGAVCRETLCVLEAALPDAGAPDAGGQDAGVRYFGIQVTVEGLKGAGLVLVNNDADPLALTNDGPFWFPTKVVEGSAYAVTVRTQPRSPNQDCTVANGAGTVRADVVDVRVTCSTKAYAVGGTVSGLSGSGLKLTNNGGDELGVAQNGRFTFATPLADRSAYDVEVSAQPQSPRQTCTVSRGTSVVNGAAVTDVAVVCKTDLYTVGGTVTGLVGAGLVLRNNGADDLGISSDGRFDFQAKQVDGAQYAVTVAAQPTNPSQTCTVADGTGTVAGGDVTTVAVTCAP